MLRNNLFSGLRNTSGMLNNSLPFSVPNMANNATAFSSSSNLLKGASKFSFTGFLDNASKTVNTINQILPIYNQVKPMVSNAKTALNIFKNVNKINNVETPSSNEQNNSSITNEEIKENPISKEKTNIIINKTNPNKPFFV